MKTEKIERLILLEQSGELNFVRRWQLGRALARQPGLQKFRDDLQQLTAVSRAAMPEGGLNPMILGEIRKAAAEQNQHGFGKETGFAPWLKPAIACAAVLLVGGGIALLNQYRPPVIAKIAAHFGHKNAKWDDGVDAEISGVSNMLAANFDTAGEAVPADANAIARELIDLEGTGK